VQVSVKLRAGGETAVLAGEETGGPGDSSGDCALLLTIKPQLYTLLGI